MPHRPMLCEVCQWYNVRASAQLRNNLFITWMSILQLSYLLFTDLLDFLPFFAILLIETEVPLTTASWVSAETLSKGRVFLYGNQAWWTFGVVA